MHAPPFSFPERVGRAAVVARWKPVHLGHAAVLEGLVQCAGHAWIGIGSSNRHDASNPFTARETREMIERLLGTASNHTFIEVPDLGNGPRWRDLVRDLFGDVDTFFTANDYVRDLLSPLYRVLHTVRLVPPDRRVPVTGTMVREAMARGDDWRRLVPPAVAAYLDENGLADRFRREFGAAVMDPTTTGKRKEAAHVLLGR